MIQLTLPSTKTEESTPLLKSNDETRDSTPRSTDQVQDECVKKASGPLVFSSPEP